MSRNNKEEVRRVQELRRSSAASPVNRNLPRGEERRLAILDALQDKDSDDFTEEDWESLTEIID
jgi:hypothetical protein